MVELGGGLRLALKATGRLGLLQQTFLSDHFQGHDAVQPGLHGLEHLAHAALSELGEDGVTRNRRPFFLASRFDAEVGRWLPQDRLLRVHHGCFRRLARLDGSMNRGLSLKLERKLWEALDKILSIRLLAELFAEQELAINNVKGLFLGCQA